MQQLPFVRWRRMERKIKMVKYLCDICGNEIETLTEHNENHVIIAGLEGRYRNRKQYFVCHDCRDKVQNHIEALIEAAKDNK